jgi:hypothetical protein
MIALATFLLATPFFGLSLDAPLATTGPHLESVSAHVDLTPALVAAALADDDSASEDEGEGGSASESGSASMDDEERVYQEESSRRVALAKQHRLLGMATWVAMTLTVALGTIQYYNLYGFGADIGSNPCVEGKAIFGQEQCTGTPWPHLVGAGITTALYTTTFTLALMMPDPDDLANAKGEFASTVRLHKTLRWVHLGGMVAQIALGIVIANTGDRANDYGTLQALSTAHLAAGVITYGALTWAGALMTF